MGYLPVACSCMDVAYYLVSAVCQGAGGGVYYIPLVGEVDAHQHHTDQHHSPPPVEGKADDDVHVTHVYTPPLVYVDV